MLRIQGHSGLFGFWLRFGSVTGFFKPAPSPKPRQNPKILATHRYIISVNALRAGQDSLDRQSEMGIQYLSGWPHKHS
jgi:hypothetical protein